MGGDPWGDLKQEIPGSVGSMAEEPVVSLTSFGAFVQLAEGVEGMIQVGDISAEKRLNLIPAVGLRKTAIGL